MTSVIVQLFLHGLIALVPLTGADGKANQMVALAVDARQEQLDKLKLPSDLSCVGAHEPLLSFDIPEGSKAQCKAVAGCRSPDKGKPTCQCVPVRKRIWFEPPFSPTPQVLPTAVPAKELPDSHAPDFSYVQNLGTAGWQLNPTFLTGAPPLLLDRMTFPFNRVTACKLAARDEDDVGKKANVHSFSFRPLHRPHDSTMYKSQATAQAVMVETIYEVSAEHPLELHISNLDGSDEHPIRLSQSGTIMVMLSDARGDMELDNPCDDGVARDFALYYLLSTKAPAKSADWQSGQFLLPHVKFAAPFPIPAKSIETPDCEMSVKLIMSHPVCAMAAYYAPK